MAATTHGPRQGRWCIPKDIPRLTEAVDDLDWWFHQMQLHLNNCRITDKQERVDCLHTHTDDAFHQRVWQRCDSESISRARMYKSEDTYRVFVADRFCKATAMAQLQRKLDALAGKSLSADKSVGRSTSPLLLLQREGEAEGKATPHAARDLEVFYLRIASKDPGPHAVNDAS